MPEPRRVSEPPAGGPFFRVVFESTDDFLILSAALSSKANADRVRAALDGSSPAMILETSPNSDYHPIWFVNRGGQSLVLQLGKPVTFAEPITAGQLPRGLFFRLGE